MKFTMENDFHKHVKSPELFRVYLLYGTQPYLIANYEKLLIAKALDAPANSFNFYRFNCENLSLQTLYDAVESISMLGGTRCVVVDLEPDKLSASEWTDLCDLVRDPPQTTTMILSVKAVPSKRDRIQALVKAIDKSGAAVELGARGRSETLKLLRNLAAKHGCELSSDCASYLMERCGEDLQTLTTEADKLCAYAGAGMLNREQIDAVCCVQLQAKIYDLSKAILRGNLAQAMELVDTLLVLRETEVGILSVLSRAFVDLYQGFSARQAGVGPAKAAAALGYPKNREFALKNGMSDSARFSAGQLGKQLKLLVEADLRLKSTGTLPRAALEQVIVELALAART